MSANDEEYKLESFPTLNEVILVENTLQKIDDSLVTIQQLKEILAKKVNSDTLKIIIDYLEMVNRIVVTSKGITWIQNNNPRLKKTVSESLEF
ncbi:unnamed protein product [marine sediment metagenome]|uniref:Uncharacterized protein n=1 Tax=marine sediment metagenome TaxID=412755 RepID=X1SAE3_9ZZZZ